jgi:uncharacterized protein (DUF1330 family)
MSGFERSPRSCSFCRRLSGFLDQSKTREERTNMAAYLIGQVIVHDMEQFAPYVQTTSAIIGQYGGEVLDVVQAVDVAEGTWPIGALTALVRFPDEASLRAFWNSPENVGMKDLRHRTATSNVAVCVSLPR